jgi:hypothetical protein
MDLVVCRTCKTPFERLPKQHARRYCSDKCHTDAANEARRKKPDHYLNRKRTCRFCEKEFTVTATMGVNTQYCDPECSRKGQRKSVAAFYGRNPDAMQGYNQRRYDKHGRDSLITRLYKRYPDLSRVCEAIECDEGRVLEAAHKPAHKRNGAWRTMKWYERHMFWMLCPTHHKLTDLGICTVAELGLS